MTDILEIINEIVKYGLHPDILINNKERDLEQNLIRLYSKYFEIVYKYDDKDYPDFDKGLYPNVIENAKKNFPEFGFYHTILNSHEIMQNPETATGDAIDDLCDIIYDLLEIKWRYENNSKRDGLWFFELIFTAHTQQHIIDLLNFIKSKNE